MSSLFYRAASSIDGRGLFAEQPFKRGQIILILGGKLQTWEIRDKSDSEKHPNWIGLGSGLWIDSPIGSLINHSCNPNMGICAAVVLVALRDIEVGEELTFDYSITEEDALWEMSCTCRTEHCRKTIRSIQFTPREVIGRYLPYVPAYFQEVHAQRIAKSA